MLQAVFEAHLSHPSHLQIARSHSLSSRYCASGPTLEAPAAIHQANCLLGTQKHPVRIAKIQQTSRQLADCSEAENVKQFLTY